jgi:hypothetical protein
VSPYRVRMSRRKRKKNMIDDGCEKFNFATFALARST